jgi:hypothetical protein
MIFSTLQSKMNYMVSFISRSVRYFYKAYMQAFIDQEFHFGLGCPMQSFARTTNSGLPVFHQWLSG